MVNTTKVTNLNLIKENLKKYKTKYNSNIPFDCHSKIRSEEACLKSTKKIIKLAKETNAKVVWGHDPVTWLDWNKAPMFYYD